MNLRLSMIPTMPRGNTPCLAIGLTDAAVAAAGPGYKQAGHESLAVPLGDDLGRLRTGRAGRPAPGAAVILRFRATPDPAGLDARARPGSRRAVARRKRDHAAVDFVGLSRFVECVAGSG